MSEAENAVKAAFFERAVQGSSIPTMRYTDLRGVVGGWRPISDRTLSRALRGLQERKELRKTKDRVYELTLELKREELPQVILAADTLSLNAGAALGVVGNQGTGWTFYGVPKTEGRKLRPLLRRAAVEFQDRVDTILRVRAREIVDLNLAKARRKGLARSEERQIRRIAVEAFDEWEAQRIEQLDSFAWIQIMEKLVPGAFVRLLEHMLKPPVGIVEDLQKGVPVQVSMERRPNEWIPYLGRLFAEDEQEVRKSWKDLLAKAKESAQAFERLRGALTVRDWKTFQNHWSAVLAMRSCICAVTR